MHKGFLLALMIFLHIIDDYCLQGILASMKQRSWWEKNAPDKMYTYDYIVALIMHSFSWSFMINLPVAFTVLPDNAAFYFASLILNANMHAVIDDMKANRREINLICDQLLHVVQILVTWACLFVP